MNYYKKDIQQISEISAYIALDKHKNTEHSMIEYKSSGFSPLKLYEAVLQTYLFCGFPATIESLRIFNKIFDKFKFPDHSQKYDFDYLMSEGETMRLRAPLFRPMSILLPEKPPDISW